MPATPTRRDALRAERLEDRTTPVSFGQPTGYDAGGAGMGIATGDFDGDGRPDAVVSSSGGVTTYLNGGGGTMTNATDLGLGVGFPRTVRVADLTGDGRLDIIAGADMSRAVAILPGNGDGTFRAPVVVAIGSPREVQGIAVADFDGDGRLDVAASTGDGVTVLLNDGSAAVLGAAPVVYPVGVDGTGRELAAADFTGDGRPDIALAVDGPDNQVAVFTNSGTGTFAAGQTVPTGIGSGPRTVLATTAAGAPLDLNGDGHTDLAVGYTGNGFVGLLLGNGDGTFRPPNTFTTGHPSVGRLVAADVDGDGHLDLVPVVGDGGATVGQQPVLLGDGAGNLAPPAQITIVGDTDMAAADLDGDGLVDLLGGGWFGLAVSLNTTRTLASFGVAAAAAATAGEGLSVTVTARNPAGEVLTGYAGTVHFTSDDPGAVLPADYTFVPSDNGVHVFTGAVLKTAGSRTVTAAGPGGTATGTATVLVSPAAAAAFALTDYPAAVAAGDPKHLTVTAYDAFGNVTTGYTGTVRFTATDPQVTAGAGLPADYTFQAADNGQHTFAGVVLKTAGTRSVTAADAADPTITGTRGGVAVGPGARAAVAAVSGGGQAATVGTDFVTPVVARVTDAFGNPVPDVAVFFPGPAAGPGADFGGGLVLVTDAAGRASVTPTANTAAGGYTVSVTASGVPGAAAFALHNTPGDPAAVVAVSGGGQTATAGADFPTPLAVRVTDAFGNPVPGTAVTFSGPAAGPGPDFPAGATTTTDADGRAGVAVRAGTAAGGYAATAAVVGAGGVGFPLTNTPGGPAAVAVVGGAGQSAPLNAAFPVPLSVRVTDRFGNPTPGVTVTFAGPAAGSGVVFPNGATATTDADGRAGVAVRANDRSGGTTVTAAAGGASAGIGLTNAPVPGLVGVDRTAAGSGPGQPTAVRFLDRRGAVLFSLAPFPGFAGGVRTAAADFNRDGVADVVAGTGPGGPSQVRVFDGATQAELFAATPFEAAFVGGVYVAAGDLDGDGLPELVVTPDEGGGPRVQVYRGAGWGKLADFLGIDDPSFRGGARAALGDLTGDGRSELVVAAGFGGGPRVSVYDGAALAGGTLAHPVGDFFLFEPGLRNGAFVAAGDLDGDGRADLVGGGGPGGGPRVLAVSGKLLLSAGADAALATPLANFFAGNVANRGGIRVAAKDLDGDARADVVAGDGAGAGTRVTGYLGKDFAGAGAPEAFGLDAFPGLTAGVFVG